ncbi:MAG: hypothetical protein NT069_35095 [Planctomycetota bacterium]|nr:hypothetical protein [Planctomycetota bacterium]
MRAVGLLLLAGWSLFAPRGLLGQAPVSSPGSVSGGQREYLGDVLIPVSSDGDATPWPDTVYVSRELRQRLAEIKRQTEIPGVLLRDVACDMGTDDQGRSVVEAQLTFCLPRNQAIRIPLPFAGVTLADERACQIAGVDQELLPAPEGIGYVLDWHPPSELASVDQNDRPAPPELPCNEESGGCVLRVTMRLFPAMDDEDQDGVRRIQIPLAARATLPGVNDDTRPGWSFVDAVGVLTSIQAFHAERISVAARLVDWRAEPKSPSRRVDPLRIEAWTLVEFDGSLALLRCAARYVPGNRPVDWLLWNIPSGMAVRQVTTPGLGGYAVTDNSQGERQLEIDFLEPRKEPFEVVVDMVLPVPNSLFELRFPDPAVTPPGGTTALELRQYRAALRYPLDRRIQISSPAVDQPLRALNLSDLEREGRFTDVTLNAAYELDRPLSLLLLIEPADMKLAGSVEQRGTVRPGQLEWKFVADGVRSTQSVFQYELQVDPRLEIRRVAVFERDERPARWSREGDRVTLFLATRAGNTQRIELTGVLPLDAHGEVDPPRVSLNRLTPLNERRLLLAPSGVDARLIVGAFPDSGSDALGVLLDAPAAPDAPWPRIRVVPTTSPVPADSETREPSTESETEEPEEITSQVMELELAEINLSRSPAGGTRGRLRLWIPAGEETEFSLVVPHEVSLDTVIWKDQVLPLLVGDSGDLKVRLPARDRGSLLEADWKLSADAPSRIPSPWGENFNRPVWPRDARVARMLFTFSYSTEALLAVRAPFRRVTPMNAAEMRRDADVIARLEDSTPAPPGVSAASEILAGSQRATTELSRTGLLAGAAWLDWPRAKPLAAGLLLLILSILLWWSSGLIYWLQARSGICTLMISLVWWIFLTPGGLGCLIAIISLPFAVRDLFREQRAM